MRMLIACGLLLAVAAVPGSAVAQDSADKDRQAVIEARESLIRALEADDLESVFAGLTADHVTMAPDVPVLSETAALRAWHEERIAAFSLKGNWPSTDLQIHGDWAIDSWAGPTTLTPRDGGEPVTVINKGVWFWRRAEDGSWKLARSIWNADSP